MLLDALLVVRVAILGLGEEVAAERELGAAAETDAIQVRAVVEIVDGAGGCIFRLYDPRGGRLSALPPARKRGWRIRRQATQPTDIYALKKLPDL